MAAWDYFVSLPDLRLRIKVVGLQVIQDEKAADLAQREQLIVNQEQEHIKTIEQLERFGVTLNSANVEPSGALKHQGEVDKSNPRRTLSSYQELYL
ncbi:hypothetical protein [Undibacterium sp. Di24W]|uniref:hypothetical protein n=1 Tax=Undibacterium sp. Di24W TaxID=3413033 RepID=UPI003BF45932